MVAGQSVVQEHDSGGGGGGMAYCSPIHSPYQGEYYPEYFVAGAAPPEMCPAHHMCTVHGDFGKRCEAQKVVIIYKIASTYIIYQQADCH